MYYAQIWETSLGDVMVVAVVGIKIDDVLDARIHNFSCISIFSGSELSSVTLSSVFEPGSVSFLCFFIQLGLFLTAVLTFY